MKSFIEREKGFEAEFKRDQELAFRVTARRNRLFGLWAAGRLGLEAGEPAETYAQSVVAADLEGPGDNAVIETVVRDITEKELEAVEVDCAAVGPRAAAKPPLMQS